MERDNAIVVDDLRKRYGDRDAVRGISFSVARGEIFGLLGPNGAGKTTTVEILEGYRERSGGDVSVLGYDPALRERTVREAVTHWAGLYPHPRDVEEVLTVAGLQEKADARARTLSGGQSRRLDLALALIGDPELIFLDEPTTGFDPAARRGAWDAVRALRALGKTVVLTTHYLDEAQALADRVAIIKDGRILAIGPPSALGAGASTRAVVTWRDEQGEPQSREVADPTQLLHELTSAALARGGSVRDLSVARPSLEDVYLELTADGDETAAEPAPEPAGV